MTSALAVIRGGGSALVLGQVGDGLPRVLHWGADLPDAAAADLALVTAGPVPHNALDEPWPPSEGRCAHRRGAPRTRECPASPHRRWGAL